MEEKQTISKELEQRILSATTAEELMALAAESGEKLTLEEAQVLLEQLHSESRRRDDLSDEELGAVAGGMGGGSTGEPTEEKPVLEMTERDGNNVFVYFDAVASYCRYWKCEEHNSTCKNYNGNAKCIVCGQDARCGRCIHRQNRGLFYHDYCTSPDVRAMHGL